MNKNVGEEFMMMPSMLGTPQVKVYREDNSIFFYDDCTEESMYTLEKNMRDIYKNIKADYINIVIDSCGGSLGGIYDFIQGFPMPTIGWVRGYCCSAATTILLGCTKRFMSPTSLLLIHSFQGEGSDYVKEGILKDEHSNIVKQNDILRSIYRAKCKIPPKELDSLLSDRESFLTAQECKKWRIVDDIQTFII